MVEINTITDLLNYWYELGVFTYLLPFLLVFAFSFGILSKSRILGKNKGVHATIAAALGGLALVNDKVPRFFEGIFPYAGIALAVLLVSLILMGLISPESNRIGRWIWFGIGAVAFVIVIWAAFEDYSFETGRLGFMQDMVPIVLTVAGVIGLMVWMIASGRAKTPDEIDKAKKRKELEDQLASLG